jgi:DNA-binding CsgD family transcriptional regulator
VRQVLAALTAVESADAVTRLDQLSSDVLPAVVNALAAETASWTWVAPEPDCPSVAAVARPQLGKPAKLTFALAVPTGCVRVTVSRRGSEFTESDLQIAALLQRALTRSSARWLPAASGPVCALTPREREVLNLLVAGLTDEAIARRLGCRPRTVGKHLEHAYRKLGVAGRVDAAMRWGYATSVVGSAPVPAQGDPEAGLASASR